MIDQAKFKETPMGAALQELGERLEEQHMPPVSINVIGGFAMMMREIRDPSGTTDIDYVGNSLPEDFNKIADEIGIKHKLGVGWINNDVMLSGIQMEDFEFATGKLHFEPAFSVGGISINVLEEPDLLRMKVISIDTSLAAIENGGDFTRAKDLEDIKTLMERRDMKPEDLRREYDEYLISPATPSVVKAYNEKGMDAATHVVNKMQESARKREEALRQRMEQRRQQNADYTTSPFLASMLADARKKLEEREKDF